MATRSQPHALVVPLPFQGHIHPLMELSKKLVSAGFMVTFANTQANHKQIKGFSKYRKRKVKKAGGGAVVVVDDGDGDGDGDGDDDDDDDEGGNLHLISLEEGFPAGFQNPFDLIRAFLEPEMKASVARLLVRLCKKDPPVCLLVFDFRLVFMQDIAAGAGIPSLSFWTQSAASFACNLLIAQGFQPPPDDSTLITGVQGVPPFKRSEVTGIFIQGIPPPFPANEYSWQPFKRIHEPTWVVLNTFEELEATTFDTLNVSLGFRPLAFGPLVNTPSFSIVQGIKENCTRVHSHLEWLQGHPCRSVLYIAFGTVVNLSEEQLEELVLGLEASQQPFLWAFRSDLCGSSEKYTTSSLSRRFKSQGVVTDWASQWHLLLHRAVGGFLTHCGWNSILEGIVAGVPMLGWPAFADQFLNRRCLEEQWGIGFGFEVDRSSDKLDITRIEIEKKVRELMQGERGKEMREKARALSIVAKRALEEGGSSHQDLMLMLQSNMRMNSKG